MRALLSRRSLSPLGAALHAGAGVLADLVFPRRCGVCGAFGPFLCGPCAAALPAATGTRCRRCCRLLAPASGGGAALPQCRACGLLPTHPLDSLDAVFRFEGGARRLVHRLKYERLSALAEPMGAAMARHLGARGTAYDLVVPVPLHPRRQRDRGFNQAALLAREIGARCGIEVVPRALVRVRATSPQVRTGAVGQRAANVAGAFACRAGVRDRVVLLVDDVATTGATLRACAEPLRAAGAAAVHALVFAHED